MAHKKKSHSCPITHSSSHYGHPSKLPTLIVWAFQYYKSHFTCYMLKRRWKLSSHIRSYVGGTQKVARGEGRVQSSAESVHWDGSYDHKNSAILFTQGVTWYALETINGRLTFCLPLGRTEDYLYSNGKYVQELKVSRFSHVCLSVSTVTQKVLHQRAHFFSLIGIWPMIWLNFGEHYD